MTGYQRIKEIETRETYQLKDGGKVADMIKELKAIEHKELYGLPIDYHAPAGANWCYRIELVAYGGLTFLTVKSFGHIIHAAYTSLYNYEREGVKNEE